MSAALHAHGVEVTLGGHRAVAGVDAAFDPGWTALVGPNGAGKSTLLRALAGLQPIDRGQVTLDGQPLDRMPARDRALRIAWLDQQGEVTGELTVRETVALGRLPHQGLLGAASAHDRDAVDRAMAATECLPWADRRLLALSGGERQRVLVARVLATEAPILLLDEPTTHLDAPHQVALTRLFGQLTRRAGEQQRTVVTVLHDLPIALRADRLLVMDRGRIRAAGSPASSDVQRALEAVFDRAIRIGLDAGGRPTVALRLDESAPH